MGCKILTLTYKNANDLELNCSGTWLSVNTVIRSTWAAVPSHGTEFCLSDHRTGSLSTSRPLLISKEFNVLQSTYLPLHSVFKEELTQSIDQIFRKSFLLYFTFISMECPPSALRVFQDSFCTRKINKQIPAHTLWPFGPLLHLFDFFCFWKNNLKDLPLLILCRIFRGL